MNFIVGLENKFMVEIWEVYRNKIFLKNFFKFVNFMVGNNVEYKNDNKIDM